MFQPLRVIIRHYYVKEWQLNTLNCHLCERDLFLTTLSATLLHLYYYMKISLTLLNVSKLYILSFIRMLIGHPYRCTEWSVFKQHALSILYHHSWLSWTQKDHVWYCQINLLHSGLKAYEGVSTHAGYNHNSD
jgi:hypothetical protein